ncbi:MAG: GNAT family N-acetyltransferase [Flavisolibacter sp.]
MTVQHKKLDGKGMFFVEHEDEIAAEMIYTTTGDKMIIEHTEIEDILKGRNIGYELVHAAVEYARHHGMKIIPLCSFTKSVMDKKPDWQDVLG